MIKDINLTSDAWTDLIFEGKNKSYGAYELRKTSGNRHVKAMIIVFCVLVVAVLLMLFGAKIKAALMSGEEDEAITETVKMSVVDLETPKAEQQIVQEAAPPPPKLKAAIKFTAPVIDKNATDEDDMKTQEEVTRSDAIVFSQDIEGSTDDDAVDPNTLDKVEQVTAEQVVQTVFDFAEIMPDFPGGEEELQKYLKANLNYPIVDAEQGIEGRVALRFVVGIDGHITDVIVQRSLSPTTDKEAIRVIKSMPRWIPGRQNGKSVPVYFSLSVRFKLDR
ncbi:MAG: TonB family protein [Dysgonamonadaceae bacterium]|jgi:protein TonB|nr:TonB family protein [Dysgonamonadaceae bacterium]